METDIFCFRIGLKNHEEGLITAAVTEAFQYPVSPRENKKQDEQGGKVIPELVGMRGWLASFFELCGDRKPDFPGLHYYGTEADGAKAYLREMHGTHKSPVVVSETASISRDAAPLKWRHSPRELGRWMDGEDRVVEYGFFGCMAHVADDFVSEKAQLVDKEGKFTELMLKLMK